jgi:hypothetical protein
MVEERVLTPAGLRLKSKVFLIDPGHSIRMRKDRAQKIHPQGGDVVADRKKTAGPPRPPSAPSTENATDFGPARPVIPMLDDARRPIGRL